MQTNIKGLVRTLDLRHAQGMMPLFEAVSNAMDAVADKGADSPRAESISTYFGAKIWPRKRQTTCSRLRGCGSLTTESGSMTSTSNRFERPTPSTRSRRVAEVSDGSPT